MVPPLLALVLAAGQATAIAARVGSETISVGEVASRAHIARVNGFAALNDLIHEALVAIAARQDGIAAEPQVKARLEAERRRLAVDGLLRQEVTARIAVSNAEVEEAFHAQTDEVRLSMVVRASEQEARGVVERMRAGSGLIGEAASSIDPAGRARSGVLGWMKRKDLSLALQRAAFSAPLNEATGPIAVEKGFAVILVHERRIGDPVILARDRQAIHDQLERKKRDEQTARFVHRLRSKAGDEIDTQRLLEDAAIERGLHRRAEVAASMRGITRLVLARAYSRQLAARTPAPPPSDVERYYREREDEFWVPAHRMCVVVDAKTEQDAQKLRARIEAGERLENLAREYADPNGPRHSTEPVPFTDEQLDAISSDQGDQHALSWTMRRAMPGLWNTIENRGHWHLVKCDAPRPRARRSLDEVSREISEAIRQQRTAALIEARVAKLRSVTKIRVYPVPLAPKPD